MGDALPERVKEVHKAIYLIDPIIKVQVICGVWVIIGRLLRMVRETVGSGSSTWNMNEGEVEKEYGYDPAIDTGGQHKVKVW